MRRREEQVAIQNAGKIEARKRKNVLEQKKATAEKKIQMEEERKDRDEKKKRAREEWQRQTKLVEKEKRREDKIQFEKCLVKTLAIEGDRSETVPVKSSVNKQMTNLEIDQEFRELNAAQMRINTRAAVDQIVGARVTGKKDVQKSAPSGLRMMRAEEGGKGECSRLPPVSDIQSANTQGAGTNENVKIVTERKGKKVVNIPTPVMEEMELEGEEVKVDFERVGNEDVVEIPTQELLKEVTFRSILEGKGIEGTARGKTLSTTFLENLMSDRMDMDLGKEYEERVQEIVQDLEESRREAGLASSPSRDIKEELIEREEVSRGSRKTGDEKVSSDSTEEVEHIMIDGSLEKESYTIRGVIQKEGDEPDPHREIPTPVSESRPYEGHEKEGRKANSRPLTAPKKLMWVRPEPEEEDVEGDERKSSSDESPESRRSPMSVISSGRVTGVGDRGATPFERGSGLR